ncbi:hypothetical protein [Bacillus sp. T3]|uniref:hypothetical protein n=1 Tax=Bacillus sp. T3 TaxID=467262 RepID=UPI002980DB28|nr:hypothetical protein [Bacillus sp. T3]
MTTRRKRLQLEEPVYTGEVITPVKFEENTELQMKEIENKHALDMRKMDIASDVMKIGKQLVNIMEIRANSEAKIDEIDAEIRKLEQITEREIASRRQAREKIEAKGKAVTDILKELTPILISQQLSTEDRKAAMEMFDRVIDKVLKDE